MIKWIKANKNDVCVFFIYVVISFCLIFFHEAWRDEAQAWLLARELSFVDLIAQMKYEGHFLLWYLILMPFAKTGFPYVTTNIISWFITSISAWLILKYAPFKTYKKYLFIFSFPMLYLFPIVSRSYCLIPLAITLIAIFYKERKTKQMRYVLAIALLANTHIIMLGMVGILLLEFFVEQLKNRKSNTKEENKRSIWSLVLILLLLVISAIPLLGCLTTNQDIGFQKSLVQKLVDMFLLEPCIMIANIYCAFASKQYLFAIITMLTIIFAYFETINYRREYINILIIFLWQYMIYAFIVSTSYQRAATGVLIIFFYRWIRVYKIKKEIKKIDKKITDITLLLLLIINIIGGMVYIGYEINNNYSTAYQVGEYINNNIEDGTVMVTGNQLEFCSSIIPYVSSDIKFYYIQEDKYFTYAVWNEKNREEIGTNFIEQLSERFDKNQKLYYIYTPLKTFPDITDKVIVNEMVEKAIFKKVFESDATFHSKETYIVYEMNINN